MIFFFFFFDISFFYWNCFNTHLKINALRAAINCTLGSRVESEMMLNEPGRAKLKKLQHDCRLSLLKMIKENREIKEMVDPDPAVQFKWNRVCLKRFLI